MNSRKKNKIGREGFSLLLVTLVLTIGFFTLHHNQKKLFENAKSAFVLTKDWNVENLSNALVSGNYISDETDAYMIAEHIKNKLDNGIKLPNLGALNKRDFRIPADSAYGRSNAQLRQRVERSREILGVNEETNEKYNSQLPSTLDLQAGSNKIEVKVRQVDRSANRLSKLMDKNYLPVQGVLVRIKEHSYFVADEKNSLAVAVDTVLGYVMTDINGIARFENLNKNRYYSVLPVREGFEYGNSKGTTKGALSEDGKFNFTQRNHQIAPFHSLTYSQIKEDNALIVRTPEEYKDDIIMHFIIFLLAWWFLHFYLSFRNRNRKIETDNLLLPVLMTLSGFCLLAMYAIINPLSDLMLGNKTAWHIVFGIFFIAIMSEIKFVEFFNDRSKIKFDFVNQFSSIFLRKINLPKGFGYIILTMLLMIALFFLGSGPEGSGVKVNLFFFQPSEISKYLIVFYFATFFTRNSGKNIEMIQKFSEEFSKKNLYLQFRTVIYVLGIILIVLGVYIGAFGDMGPALVLAITFILIYSLVRGDLIQMFIGIVTFIGFLVAGWLINKTTVTLAIFSLLWLVLWIAVNYLLKKKLFESAIFINLVIATFIFGGFLLTAIGFDHQGQRLSDRTEVTIWSHNNLESNNNGIWDNEIKGGAQIVNGIWALASGGFAGQGLGKGSPNFIPAFNTDMIIASIGEELGLAALILIILCMSILLHRCVILARRAGNTFAFFLIIGIAVLTGVQFLVIALGSTGLIPLTGVAVPFLSYGGSSMFFNLAAFGIILSLSRTQVTEGLVYNSIKKYENGILAGYGVYAVVCLFLLGFLFNYTVVNRDLYLLRYAAVTNTEGARTVEYNPRINQLMKKLYAGNIYDRNGLLLATNEKELLQSNATNYIKSGVEENTFNDELRKHQTRYYPFGNHLFFMLGDFNTKVLWNNTKDNPYGYMAESRHLAALRGFDNLRRDKDGKIITINLTAQKFRPNSFLEPQRVEDIKFTDYNYSALLPMLKEGKDSRKVEIWNEKRDRERNLTLTLDAALQTKMQNAISRYVAENFKNQTYNKLRISVVVLNAKNGDLLCSANYPLPEQDVLRSAPNVYNERVKSEKAYTDRDLGLTFQTAPGSTAKVISALAGFQKLGTNAGNITYRIDEKETVEPPSDEPNFQRDGHNTTMEEAIRNSSNNYFINLVNDQNLYSQLDSIYQTIGIRIDKEGINEKGQTFIEKVLTPYFFEYDISAARNSDFKNEVASKESKAISIYNDYISKRTRNNVYERMKGYQNGHDWNQCAWAWGQGTLRATPLNMARTVSIVANNGVFMPTQFILEGNKNLHAEKLKPITIVSENSAKNLNSYMQNETTRHRANNFPENMGGKTGTPERGLKFDSERTIRDNVNDGWYIFFIWSEKEKANLAVAVRMERLFDSGSRVAVQFSDKVIVNNVLRDLEYIR